MLTLSQITSERGHKLVLNETNVCRWRKLLTHHLGVCSEFTFIKAKHEALWLRSLIIIKLIAT